MGTGDVDGQEVTGVELGRVIGRGASSVVYLGTQIRFGRPVAVKVLHLPGQSELVTKLFLNECRTLGQLTPHPNIVSLFDGGFIDAQRPYLVMEYLPGGTLADQLSTSGPLPVEEVLRIGVQLAGGLHSAHLHDIVHGDIKPQNILRSRTGEVALGDFGVARLSSVAGATTRVPLLTPLHAAPELFDGSALTPRSDIYELCSTLFELLDGAASLGSPQESPLLVLGRMAKGAQRPLDRSRVPDVVADVVEAGLAQDPLDRPASALELGERLRDAQRALGVDLTPIVVIEPIAGGSDLGDPEAVSTDVAASDPDRAAPGEPDASMTLPPVGSGIGRPRRRRSAALVAVVLVAVVLAVSGTWIVMRRGSEDQSVTASGGAGSGARTSTTSSMPAEVEGGIAGGIQRDVVYDLPQYRDESSVLAARIGDPQTLFGKFDPSAAAIAQPTYLVERLPAQFRWQSFNPTKNPRCFSVVTWPLTLVGLWEKAATWPQHQAAVRVMQFGSERDAREALAAFSLEQGIKGDECSGFARYPTAFDHTKLRVQHRAVDLGLGDHAQWNSFVAPPPAGTPELDSITTAIVQRGDLVVTSYVGSGGAPADPAVLGAVLSEVLRRAGR